MHNLAFILIALAIYVSAPVSRASAQDSMDARQRTAARKVEEIVQRILDRGTRQDGEVVSSTWTPPSNDDLAQIGNLGHDAIEPLSAILNSAIPFRQLLAVRLLEEVGGPDVVAPLKHGLEAGHWVVVRTQSLSSLRSAPDVLALPIICSAQYDQDSRVAQRATFLLTEHYKMHDPLYTCSAGKGRR